MATYSLSGSGTQALSSGTVALHVTISTLPAGAGHGLANPTDYWGIGSVRPGNATAFWEPYVICGGPQWLPVPFGTTRLGYSFASDAVVSVAEVFYPAPLAYPLALLPDVAFGTLADAQVLTYQASTGHWINAAAAGGGGSTPTFIGASVRRTASTSIANNTITYIPWSSSLFDTDTMSQTGGANPSRLTAHTAGKYVVTSNVRGSNASFQLWFEKNHSGTPLMQAATYQFIVISWIVDLAVNDYVECVTYIGSGSGTYTADCQIARLG